MTRTQKLAAIATILAVVGTVGAAIAHSGGLNPRGCHHKRGGGYHCHRSYDRPIPRVPHARVKVVAVPRARVWVGDVYVGMSPTSRVSVEGSSVTVKLEHSLLGTYKVDYDVSDGGSIDIDVLWR